MDVPQEWSNLLDTVIANEDVFLMGLDGGTESLKIASKQFMKSKGVTGQTSEQAIKYLNDNVKELTDWIKQRKHEDDKQTDLKLAEIDKIAKSFNVDPEKLAESIEPLFEEMGGWEEINQFLKNAAEKADRKENFI